MNAVSEVHVIRLLCHSAESKDCKYASLEISFLALYPSCLMQEVRQARIIMKNSTFFIIVTLLSANIIIISDIQIINIPQALRIDDNILKSSIGSFHIIIGISFQFFFKL